MKKMAIVLLLSMVVACSTPKANSPQASQANHTSALATESPTISTGSIADEIDLRTLTAEIQKLEKQSDYFDFDKFAIKPEYQGVIQKEAEFIKAHKNDIVTLDGNADERGSENYNLALGEKRAEAVERSLEMLGVPLNQVKVVSLGKDKPRLTCHQERCWQENRRVDFVHQLN